jgi:hypothetical protein
MSKFKSISQFAKWFLLIAFLVGFNFSNPTRLLSVLIIIALVPAIYIAIKLFGSESRGFSPIILVSVYFGASFAVGAYIFATFQTYLSSDSFLIFKMSAMSVVGVYSIVLGASLLKNLYSNYDKVNRKSPINNIRYPIYVFLIIGWLSRLSVIRSGRYFHLSDTDLVQTTTQTSFMITSLANLPTICIVICVSRYLRGTSPSRLKIVVILLTDLIYHSLSGSRQSLLVPVVAFGFAWLNNGGNIPRIRFAGQLFLGISSVLTLSFISEYRVVRFQRDQAPLSALVEAGRHFLKDGIVKQIETSSLTVFERASDVISMALAYSIPRNELQDIIHNPFALIPTTLIPRVLLPNKVDYGLVGNRFGRSIGLLNPGDYFTSINYPLPLEGYLWNGILGVVLVCGVSGMIYFAIHRFIFFNRNDLKDGIYGATMLSLFNSPATILAHGIFGWMKSAGFLYLILMVLSNIRVSTHRD